jgi:hypothetical protein
MRAVADISGREGSRVAAGVVLLLLLAGFALLASLPDSLAMVRLAGLSMLWWYGGVVAPLLACLAAGALRRRGGSDGGASGRARASAGAQERR